MDIIPPPPPPPLISIPQLYNNNNAVSQHHSSSPMSSLIIVIIIISSAIIVTATIYLLIRFISRRFNRTTFDDVVSDNRNDVESLSLPLFTFSSLTGKIAGGDCAVCLSKFEGVDQLMLLPLCCHAFHAQCIDEWLKSNQTCPLCRSTVNPSEDDVMNKIAAANGGNRSNSFRIHIGSISRRSDPTESDRRSYSIGSYEYVVDDNGYEISVESTHRRGASDCISVDKDSRITEPPGENEVAGSGSGRRNWWRDYVDRVSLSLSSRTQSLRGSGRFFTGGSRRNETVEDFEASHGRIGEEISELFRWFSGV